ncbi:hypothetical protein HDG32_003368 [Paraburkholderia sp. CI2]|uniref:hypothetical protein n=1 Tax=Paraburkholderia sp. CI2 TaxID=2723093 RepID=UPI001613C288|nr:hypothetical protein [Paraburkholderia sp. CI2]MBB5467248.1 hypothetical protein [Paraburkholderia sp. CI2]
MRLQEEYGLANETAERLLRENCGLDPATIQAHIAHHLAERGDNLDEETQMILRGCMVALNVMHRQIDVMASSLGLPPYRSDIEGGAQ